MNQRLDRLDGVAPLLRRPVLRLIALAQEKMGVTLLLVHGFRSVQEQARLYQRGRRYDPEQAIWVVDDPSQLVTKAKPGTSAHNIVDRLGTPAALAVDLIPLDADTGQPNWHPDALFWDELYELGWKVGLDPLGDPVGAYYAPDKGHFEEPGYALKLEGLGLVVPGPVLTQA